MRWTLLIDFRFCLLAVSLLGFHKLTIAQEATIPVTENLVADGLPPIPASLVDSVRRYTEARSASILDWHPTERQMLVSTRFGNSNQVHLVKFPGGARQQLTFFAEPIGSATFDPTRGSYFVFSRDSGGNEFAQLYRYDVNDGTITPLSDGGRSQNGGITWSHSKDRAAYMSTRRNGADRDIWLIDPRDPKSDRILVENSGGGWSVNDWSPDDQRLLVSEYLSVNRSNLYLVDIKTAQKQKLNDDADEVAYSQAQFSADGKDIYLTCDRGSEFQQLCVMNLDNRKIEPILNTSWDVELMDMSPDRKSLMYSVNEAGISRVYLMDVATRRTQPIVGLPVGVVGSGKWHANSREYGISISSARSTSDVYSIDIANQKVVRWTESELGGLIADQLSEPKLIQWKSFDGLELSGFYYQPPAKFTGKRPVIINIHGGPEGQSRPVFQGRNNFYLNELGVAIIYPNVRGSVGYGKTFVKLDNGFNRLDTVKDIGALLDWIASQPDLDPSRVMVTGGSYGGYMTLMCATTYNDRISCSLDVVGISHFGTFLKNTESYRRDLRRVEYGDERDPEMAKFFDSTAPLNNAKKINKPIFIVQGGNDPRVPLSEADQMASQIKRNGTSLWYLMAKDEGHGFRKKNNADFQFYATIEFVRRYLQP